jgi:hypothetical protein
MLPSSEIPIPYCKTTKTMSEHRLNEITIERPRNGMRLSSTSLKGNKKLLYKLTKEASDDGLFQPYLIKVRNRSKYLSDHLAPLRRLLYSKVGQHWDEVYREICQRLDANTMLGQHVIDHLWDYVERHVEIVNGIPHRKAYRGIGGYELGNRWYGDEFYIHPDTGILCLATRSPKTKSQPQTLQRDDIAIIGDRYYRRLDGIWYCITFQDLPSLEKVRDVIIKELITPQVAEQAYGKAVYAASKRQCNKKEIKIILAKIAGDVAQRTEHHFSKVSRAGSNPAILVMGL